MRWFLLVRYLLGAGLILISIFYINSFASSFILISNISSALLLALNVKKIDYIVFSLYTFFFAILCMGQIETCIYFRQGCYEYLSGRLTRTSINELLLVSLIPSVWGYLLLSLIKENKK